MEIVELVYGSYIDMVTRIFIILPPENVGGGRMNNVEIICSYLKEEALNKLFAYEIYKASQYWLEIFISGSLI